MTENKYNPMSKEFQDEAKKLGLTGRQLTVKYQKEGKFLEKFKKKVKICCNCNSCDTYVDTRGYENWHKHKCEKMVCTEYLCVSCFNKLEADCRNNNLDPNSEQGIGYITATLVKKFLGIEDCFDMTGNFCYPEYDMIEHEDWGLIDAKGSSLLEKIDGHLRHQFHIRKNKKTDFFFCIGFDKNRKHVIAVFIIPNDKDISKLDAIDIPYNRRSKYNKHKESEEEVNKWDDLFHTMKLDNCSVLRKNC